MGSREVTDVIRWQKMVDMIHRRFPAHSVRRVDIAGNTALVVVEDASGNCAGHKLTGTVDCPVWSRFPLYDKRPYER